MLLPIRSESGPEVPARSPIASYLLAALVVLLSLCSFGPLEAHRQRLLERVGDGDGIFAGLKALRDGTLHVDLPGLLDLAVLQRGAHFKVTQLVGVAFVHGDVAHLVGNVLLLLIFGGPVCRAIGGWRFVALWLGCAALASLGWLVAGDSAYAVGASGVVMGLGVTCVVALPDTRVWILCNPLSWIAGAVCLFASLMLGDLWVVLLPIVVVVAWIFVMLRSWSHAAEGPPEGIIARVLGFVVFRPRLVWLMGLFLVGDVVGVVIAHGDGPLAQILRLTGGGVAHEAHLAGALGGLLGGWLLLSAGAVEQVAAVVRPAPATERLRPIGVLPAARPVLWVDSGCAPGLEPPAKVTDFEGWRAQRDATPRAGVALVRPTSAKADPKVGTRSVRRPPPPPLPVRGPRLEEGLLWESPV